MVNETSSGQWRPGKRVAIIGAGPGGVSTAMAMHMQGYDVRLYEGTAEPKPLGGGVLLSVPVLAVLRNYGIDIENFGSFTRTHFANNKGKHRVRQIFNPEVEKAMGIRGWHYGVLRSSAYERMLKRMNEMDPDILIPGHRFVGCEDVGDEVFVRFANGQEVTCDILIGADGIRSKVSEHAFGDPKLFHTGLRLWLAWCGEVPGLPNDSGCIYHSRRIQASYFPMLHDGKDGFEWWIVEPVKEGETVPENPQEHVRRLLADFVDPMPRFLEHTDFGPNMFRWEIYNRPSIDSYTKGRIACVGDACHPVSPHAAYGMGMAIEDGYFLARALGGRDLREPGTIEQGYARYNSERVAYCNKNVEFARFLGDKFHYSGKLTAWVRDMIFDHTGALQRMIDKGMLEDSANMSLQLRELHVA